MDDDLDEEEEAQLRESLKTLGLMAQELSCL